MNFFGVGAFELALVAVVALLTFGPDNVTRSFLRVAERTRWRDR